MFCTYPLEVVRVRLAFETRRDHRVGLRELCRNIRREPHVSYTALRGYSNFYRGFSPTVLGMLPYAGVSFLVHDLAGDWLRSKAYARYPAPARSAGADEDKKPVLKAWAELASGGVAGAAGQTASYPLEVIRRRMQVGGAMGDVRFPGIAETAAKIWCENGIRGFFVGLSIGYAKVIPMVACVAPTSLVAEQCGLMGLPERVSLCMNGLRRFLVSLHDVFFPVVSFGRLFGHVYWRIEYIYRFVMTNDCNMMVMGETIRLTQAHQQSLLSYTHQALTHTPFFLRRNMRATPAIHPNKI